MTMFTLTQVQDMQREYREEVKGLHLLIVAMIRSCGGTIKVPDVERLMAGPEDSWECVEDKINRCWHIKVKQ